MAASDRMSATEQLADGFAFLESPRWHEGRLWAVDLYAQQVLCFDRDAKVETRLAVPGTPTGLGWLPDGRMLVATRERRILHCGDAWTEFADLTSFGPAPLNELTVTASGDVYVGVFGLATGALLHVGVDGSVRVAAEQLLLPNGQGLIDQGETLLVAESAGQRLTALTLNPDGSLTNRRVWARFGDPATAKTLPEVVRQVTRWVDGIAADPTGAVWVADPFGRQAFRTATGGEITHRVSTSPLGCYACALADDGTLYLCAAPPGEDEATRRRDRTGTLLRAQSHPSALN